jgi:NhaP-type Na+/H+ or K+/H+ antiporter
MSRPRRVSRSCLAVGLWLHAAVPVCMLSVSLVPAAAGAQGFVADLRPDNPKPLAGLKYAYNKQNPRPYAAPRPTPRKPLKSLQRPPGELAQRRQHREASRLLGQPVLLGLTGVVVLIVGIQCATAALHLPVILVSVLLGLAVGPGMELVSPDALFGNLLLPAASLLLALILFEESSSLYFDDLRSASRALSRLVSIGFVVAGFIGTLSAHLVLNLSPPLAVLLGVVVALTGPRLDAPLAEAVSPHFGGLLQREGVLLDLIGSVLAVLVFQGILFGTTSYGHDAPTVVVNTLWIGAVVGLVGAACASLLRTLERVPDNLQRPLVVTLVFVTFSISELFQPASGLVAVVAMGLTVANWKPQRAPVAQQHHQPVSPLLASGLLLILAARLPASELAQMDTASAFFLAIALLLVRPAAVWLCTLDDGWTWRERLLFVCMAPRGVVAAILSTVFALRLAEAGLPQAREIALLTLLVVFGTAAIDALVVPLLQRPSGIPSAGSEQRLKRNVPDLAASSDPTGSGPADPTLSAGPSMP